MVGASERPIEFPVEIYDATLRDGTPSEGVTFSVADKARITRDTRASVAGTLRIQTHDDIGLGVAEVRIVNSRSATDAKTRVLIETSDGVGKWGTVGVDTNIVAASVQALVDSFEYALVRHRPAEVFA